MNELLILSGFDLHKTLFIIHQVCFKSFLSKFLDMNIFLDYEYFLNDGIECFNVCFNVSMLFPRYMRVFRF